MTNPKAKLAEILFGLSVQHQIEGYEKSDPKRPASIREGKSS